MKLQTLEDLLVHQIQDILSAEHQVKKALPRMAEAVGSDTLRKAFKNHQKETDAQIERLEKAFELMDQPVSASHCEAAEGLITEAEDYLNGDGNRDVLDAGLVTAAQRFEHYEIAAYGSAISFARQLNQNEPSRGVSRRRKGCRQEAHVHSGKRGERRGHEGRDRKNRLTSAAWQG